MVKADVLKSVVAVTGGAAPFGPALIESFMEKVKPNGHEVEFREGNTLGDLRKILKAFKKSGDCTLDTTHFNLSKSGFTSKIH